MTMLTQTQMSLIFNWIQSGLSPAAPVSPPNILPLGPTFASIQRNILNPKCITCHSGQAGRPDYSNWTKTLNTGSIKPNDPVGSLIMNSIGSTPTNRMPPSGTQLSMAEQKAISDWIAGGALDN